MIHDRVPIQKVKPLTEEDYYVRGCTALLDAVGGAIRHIGRCHKYAKEGDAPEKTLFVITTDGLENASVEYSQSIVKHMIETEQEKYGWEFVFLGANIDAVNEGRRIGIREKRSVDYINDSRGIRKSYEVLGDAMYCMSTLGDIEDSSFDDLREDYDSRKKARGRKGRRP